MYSNTSVIMVLMDELATWLAGATMADDIVEHLAAVYVFEHQ